MTKEVRFQLSLVLIGVALMHVDDAVTGCCPLAALTQDVEVAKMVFESLFCTEAVNYEKDKEDSPGGDTIGYWIALTEHIAAGISNKNLYKVS
jgi:hypothetical protein